MNRYSYINYLPLALVGLIDLKYGNYIYINIFFIGVLFRKYTSLQPIIQNFACNPSVRNLALGIHTLILKGHCKAGYVVKCTTPGICVQ